MIDILEYRGVTTQDIVDVTGIQNIWKDIKYPQTISLPRQKMLLLKEAKRQNVLHKVKKSHPKEYKIVSTIKDKDLEILTCTPFTPQPRLSSILNLNQVPHKVIRENNKVIIEISRTDMPDYVLPNPGSKPSYKVIGIFTQEDCYNDGGLFEDGTPYSKRLGKKYSFRNHSNVSLHILD